MLIEIALQTSKKRACLLMTFIIIMLMFWRTDSWAASINYLNMQLILISLSNIAFILIFSIIMFIVKQATTYIKRRKTTRATIFFKCIDFVELNLIKSTCIFFFFIIFDDAIISRFFDIVFIFSFVILRNICLNSSKEISSTLRNRISMNIFNIYLMILTKLNCSLIICVNLLNLFKILIISIELNLICLIFLYLTTREFKLITTEISFIEIFILKI